MAWHGMREGVVGRKKKAGRRKEEEEDIAMIRYIFTYFAYRIPLLTTSIPVKLVR